MLKAGISKAVSKAVAALDDIAKSVSYFRTGTPTYNAATGAITRNETEYTSVKIFMTAYRRYEVDGSRILADDRKVLLPQNNLSVTPTINDRIVDGTDSWEVVGVVQDPASALWSLQVRRP